MNRRQYEDMDQAVKDAMNAKALQEWLSGVPGHDAHDMDTVLADAMDEAETEVSGVGLELVGLYLDTYDKETFERLFEMFAGTSWTDYLSRSIAVMKDTLRRTEGSEEGEGEGGGDA